MGKAAMRLQAQARISLQGMIDCGGILYKYNADLMDTVPTPMNNSTELPNHPVILQDVADACGVSKMTVSRALRPGHPDTKPATAERIRAIAKEMGYDPMQQGAAKRLALRRTGRTLTNHLVGVFMTACFTSSPFHSAIFTGLSSGFCEEGFGMLLVDTEWKPMDRFPASVCRGEVDGALLGGFEDLHRLEELRLIPGFGARPVVSLYNALPGCSSVLADRMAGARLAAEHLFALGHRHLACFGPGHQELLHGYRDACATYHLDPSRHLHELILTETLLEYGFCAWNIPEIRAPRRLPWDSCAPIVAYLRQHPEVTAILAPNDPSAVLLHYLLTSEGWRVPEDISLIGFDDTEPIYDADDNNILTTIRLPLNEIGKQAAHILVGHITGKCTDHQHLIMPTQLIVRGSTAPLQRT